MAYTRRCYLLSAFKKQWNRRVLSFHTPTPQTNAQCRIHFVLCVVLYCVRPTQAAA